MTPGGVDDEAGGSPAAPASAAPRREAQPLPLSSGAGLQPRLRPSAAVIAGVLVVAGSVGASRNTKVGIDYRVSVNRQVNVCMAPLLGDIATASNNPGYKMDQCRIGASVERSAPSN